MKYIIGILLFLVLFVFWCFLKTGQLEDEEMESHNFDEKL